MDSAWLAGNVFVSAKMGIKERVKRVGRSG